MFLEITGHAVKRYQQRVRPGLDRHDAQLDLERILTSGVASLEDDPPYWKSNGDDQVSEAEFWLMLGEDVCFPIVAGRLVTCITNSGLPPGIRKHRNDVAQGKRRSRKYKDPKPAWRSDGQPRGSDGLARY